MPIRSGNRAIEFFDGSGLRQIQRFALGNAVNDVEKDDVAKFLKSCQKCERATNVTRTDERDFVT